jgi:4-amino-4-deoxy-L-arabinose transferase-like glycosyltransferase
MALLAHVMVRGAGGSPKAADLAAFASGVVMGSMELTWQVAIWLACDAPLQMGVAVALFGAWRGLQAAPGRDKLGWYLLMHLGLLVGFFSKNAIAWIIPGLAVITWLAWERRWRELARWEWWSGLLLQMGCIVIWIMAVASGPQGAENLRIFFVENLVGRFLPWFQGLKDYNGGHANWPGKYLVELPAYLLPWLFLAVAAAVRGRTACVVASPMRSAWRFALCIIIPNLLLLSVASTGRGIYLAPVLCGFAVLIGLWASEQLDSDNALDRHALTASGLLLSVVGLAMLPGAAIASWMMGFPVIGEVWVLLAACSAVGLVKTLVLIAHIRARRRADILREMLVTLVVVVTLGGLAAPRLIDAWQDLSGVARMAVRHAAMGRFILYDPDETTIAALDYHAGLTPPYGGEMKVVGDFDCRALRKMPGKNADYANAVKDMAGKGWHLIERFDIPFGRRYAVFSTRPPSVDQAP